MLSLLSLLFDAIARIPTIAPVIASTPAPIISPNKPVRSSGGRQGWVGLKGFGAQGLGGFRA